MVIKGGARGKASSLTAHLERTDTNERMHVAELRGVLATDLAGALREMEAVASGARSGRPFYHASINTGPAEALTPEQQARAIDRLETELGLTGQPRVVVEHVKEGRAHVHVVWSRIDLATMTAISDSHNFRRHEIVARELERTFGHQRVQGAHIERDGIERPSRTPRLAEMRQAERTGISPAAAKAQLRALWGIADTGRAFAAALEDAGWILARGDKRGFVALDPAGEVRSINKDITGLPAAKVRERLADIEIDTLPSVHEARAQQRDRQRERDQTADLQRQAEREPQSTPAPVSVATLRLKTVPILDPTKPEALAPELCQEASREPKAAPGREVAELKLEAVPSPENASREAGSRRQIRIHGRGFGVGRLSPRRSPMSRLAAKLARTPRLSEAQALTEIFEKRRGGGGRGPEGPKTAGTIVAMDRARPVAKLEAWTAGGRNAAAQLTARIARVRAFSADHPEIDVKAELEELGRQLYRVIHGAVPGPG